MNQEEPSKRKRRSSDYIPNHYTPYYFRRIKKEFPEIEEKDLRKAVSMYFKLCRDELALGHKINLQNKLGNLYLKKEKREVFINDKGEIVNELPINIRETSRLWREKPEIKNKVFVRYVNDHTDNCLFSLHYESGKAIYKNKSIYNFVFNRGLKSELSTNIFDKKVDAFLKKYKDE